MIEVGAEAARRRLPELLERAHAGESSIIKKRGVPYAVLVPLNQQIAPGGSGLLALLGTGSGLWGKDVSGAVDKYRDEWE